jgi:MFS family permease
MNSGTVPNAKRLLWAGFFCIFAAGVGFAVRGRILATWASEYGFTQKELGDISGGGLWGFGLVIIIGCMIADRIGYGKLVGFAFVMHLLSAALQLCTGQIYEAFGREGVYWSLTAAMVMFSIANGTCEVVVNPMVATLFPKEKTHYLNILHAGWPGGLLTGGVIAFLMNDVFQVHWIIQMSMFLIPVGIYGLMLLGQHMPRSEASEAGVSYGEMLAVFAAPMLLLLMLIHAMVGYVELGTDSWIQKITGTITASPLAGTLLFIYTNILMFGLRFFAGPIEHRISPLGLLFSCSVIAMVGLLLLGNAVGVFMCLLAVTVYGVGKTFFWPTMLAVVSERFPKGGALTLGAIGGVGMLSGGLLGGPGIGFKQDHYAGSELRSEAPATYQRYTVATENTFLGVFHTKGLDGTKVGLLALAANRDKHQAEAAKLGQEIAALSKSDPKYQELERKQEQENKAAADTDAELKKTVERLRKSDEPEVKELATWWDANQQYVPNDSKPVDEATLYGSRMALKWTAVVPAMMAVLYLGLLLYFRMRGGYTKVTLDEKAIPETPM